MAKIAKHFEITKILPDNFGYVEFSGIVYNNNAETYHVEDVMYTTTCFDTKVTENITEFFKMYRECTEPTFFHDDIVELLTELIENEHAQEHQLRTQNSTA